MTRHIRLRGIEPLIVEDVRALHELGSGDRAIAHALTHFHGEPFTKNQVRHLRRRHGIVGAGDVRNPSFVDARRAA